MFAKGEGKKRWYSLVKHHNYHICESELTFIKELRGDVFLVQFPGYPEMKNILGLFADSVTEFGRFALISPHLSDTGYDTIQAYSWENTLDTIWVDPDYGSYETDLKFFGIENKKGMCGLPYIHVATGKVVAIHMGGVPSRDVAMAVSVLKEDLEPWQPKYVTLDGMAQCLEDAPLIRGIQVLGRVPPQSASFIPKKTKLRESQFDYKTLPYPETEDGPAYLEPFDKDGKLISPLNIAVEKFGNQVSPPMPPDPKTVHDCLPKTFNPKNIRVISIEEAVFGIPGYMKSIDMDSSLGYFLRKMGFTSRRQLCYDELGQPSIHPLLRRMVEQRIENAREMKIHPVVFEETLKDEIRSKEKRDRGETRLFSSGDFASFIVQRMYLGTFFVEFTKDPVGSCVGLGINPHSAEWGALYSRLRGTVGEGRECGAGDFSNYDISLKNKLMELFIKLVVVFYDGENVVIVELVIRANFNGWHIMGRIIFVRAWGTSSGSFITSMFNTFCNWCLHKMAFIAVYSEEEWKVVQTTFTGDDSVFSVPKGYEKYNMQYLSDFFWERCGMRYTSPTKTADMNVDWEDLIYLKRKFVVGHMGIMAPLAERSLANMIKWTDTDQDREVMQSVLNSLLQETWHYGPEKYEEVWAWAFLERRRTGINFDLPKFEDLTKMRQADY